MSTKKTRSTRDQRHKNTLIPATSRLDGIPAEFSKIGDVGQIAEAGWAKIPSYYYDFAQHCLPLTEDEFNNEFDAVRSVFTCEADNADGSRQTNAACGSGVNEAFLATGLCIIAFGEGEAFAQNGVVLDTPAATSGVPAVVAIDMEELAQEGYAGVANLSGESAAEAQHAQLNWGSPTWRLIEKYFKNTRLQVNVNRRFQVVDENLLDIGMCPLPPEFVGASCSKIGTQNMIRRVNETMSAKEIGKQFLTSNIVVLVGESLCIPPPLAGVTYGHPRIVGLSNRIYCFTQPLLFVPGMRFDLQLVPVGPDFACDDMLATATMQCVTPGPLYEGSAASLAGSCGVVCTVPGGSITLGVVLKGYSLMPQACLQYILNFVLPGGMMSTILSDVGSINYVQSLVTKMGVGATDPRSKRGLHEALGVIGTPPAFRAGQQ